MKKNLILKHSKLIKIFAIVLLGIGFIYAMVINPLPDQSRARLKEMRDDLNVLLPNESGVLYRQDFAKSGGALLLRGLSAAAWNKEFKSKYFGTLVRLGWRRIDPEGFYCKNDMSISTYDHVIDYRGRPVEVVDITMDYSALSKRRCGIKGDVAN